MKRVLSPTLYWLTLLLIMAPGATSTAQTQPGRPGKSAKAESCDGVLDMVPSKAMTFIRKRRPAGGESKPGSAPATTKSSGTTGARATKQVNN